MKNSFETGPERIPDKAEVLQVIFRFAESPTVVRELYDDKGLYLLEATVSGENPGETTEYRYTRKGVFPDHIESLQTVIHRVYYEGEMPVTGDNVAFFEPESDEWKDVV